jgi:Flp pilus assembly protein TadG
MKKHKSERGQSLVELSISLLVLLYLLSGAVEFGLAFFQFVQLRDAAQEGALFGSMDPSNPSGLVPDPIETRVRAASSSPIDLADTGRVEVTLTAHDKDDPDPDHTIPVNGACEGDALTVTVEFEHQIFMPFIPQLIGRSTLPLKATVTDTVLAPVQTAPSCH